MNKAKEKTFFLSLFKFLIYLLRDEIVKGILTPLERERLLRFMRAMETSSIDLLSSSFPHDSSAGVQTLSRTKRSNSNNEHGVFRKKKITWRLVSKNTKKLGL